MNDRFPKACRLTKQNEIRAVFARRDVFRGQRLHFYRGPVSGGEPTEKNSYIGKQSGVAVPTGQSSPTNSSKLASRYCLMVSKQCGTAVRRNRVKRVLREIIRHNRHRIPPGHNYIIRVDCSRLADTGKITEKDFIDDFTTYFGWT